MDFSRSPSVLMRRETSTNQGAVASTEYSRASLIAAAENLHCFTQLGTLKDVFLERVFFRHFDPGDVIMAQGEPAENWAVVVNGLVSINQSEEFTIHPALSPCGAAEPDDAGSSGQRTMGGVGPETEWGGAEIAGPLGSTTPLLGSTTPLLGSTTPVLGMTLGTSPGGGVLGSVLAANRVRRRRRSSTTSTHMLGAGGLGGGVFQGKATNVIVASLAKRDKTRDSDHLGAGVDAVRRLARAVAGKELHCLEADNSFGHERDAETCCVPFTAVALQPTLVALCSWELYKSYVASLEDFLHTPGKLEKLMWLADERDEPTDEDAMKDAPWPGPRRPAVVDEICSVIKRHKAFSDLSRENLERVAKLMRARYLVQGEIYIEQGQWPEAVSFVLKGSVGLYSTGNKNVKVQAGSGMTPRGVLARRPLCRASILGASHQQDHGATRSHGPSQRHMSPAPPPGSPPNPTTRHTSHKPYEAMYGGCLGVKAADSYFGDEDTHQSSSASPYTAVAHEDTFLLQLMQTDYPLVHQCILLGVPESLKTPQGQKEFDDVLLVRPDERTTEQVLHIRDMMLSCSRSLRAMDPRLVLELAHVARLKRWDYAAILAQQGATETQLMLLLRGQVYLFVRTGFKQEARNVLLQKLREHSKAEEELYVASLAVGTVTVTPAQALQAVNHPEQHTAVGRRRHCYVTGETIGGRSLLGMDRRHEGTAIVAQDNTYMIVINEENLKTALQCYRQENLYELVNFLGSSVPLLRGCSDVVLRTIALHVNLRVFDRNAEMVQERAEATKVYIVKSGMVIISVAAEHAPPGDARAELVPLRSNQLMKLGLNEQQSAMNNRFLACAEVVEGMLPAREHGQGGGVRVRAASGRRGVAPLQVQLSVLGVGAMVGHEAVLGRCAHPATASCSTRVEVLEMDAKCFLHKLPPHLLSHIQQNCEEIKDLHQQRLEDQLRAAPVVHSYHMELLQDAVATTSSAHAPSVSTLQQPRQLPHQYRYQQPGPHTDERPLPPPFKKLGFAHNLSIHPTANPSLPSPRSDSSPSPAGALQLASSTRPPRPTVLQRLSGRAANTRLPQGIGPRLVAYTAPAPALHLHSLAEQLLVPHQPTIDEAGGQLRHAPVGRAPAVLAPVSMSVAQQLRASGGVASAAAPSLHNLHGRHQPADAARAFTSSPGSGQITFARPTHLAGPATPNVDVRQMLELSHLQRRRILERAALQPVAKISHCAEPLTVSSVRLPAKVQSCLSKNLKTLGKGEGMMRELAEGLRSYEIKQDKELKSRCSTKLEQTKLKEMQEQEVSRKLAEAAERRAEREQTRQEELRQRLKLLEMGGGNATYVRTYDHEKVNNTVSKALLRLWQGVENSKMNEEVAHEKRMFRIIRETVKMPNS